jgi:hypothetical protein
VIICGIGIYFLHSNLNDTQDKLELANADIQRKIGEITNKTDTILDLKVQLARINSVRKELLLDVKEIRTYYPFIVTSFDIKSDIISIDYFCSWECEIPFTLEIINLSKSKMSTTDGSAERIPLVAHQREPLVSLKGNHPYHSKGYRL